MIGRALVMTKKLLIVFLVGSISPLSFGATAWYEADGSTSLDVTAGQVVTITLNSDIAVGAFQLQIINDNGRYGNAFGTVQPPWGIHPSLAPGGPIPEPPYGANSNNKLFYATAPQFSFYGSQGMLPAAPAGADIIWFDYVVPNLAISTVITIDSYNENDAWPASVKEFVQGSGGTPSITDMTAVTLHIVPEPMTIALLGLGGLFLLRRRK